MAHCSGRSDVGTAGLTRPHEPSAWPILQGDHPGEQEKRGGRQRGLTQGQLQPSPVGSTMFYSLPPVTSPLPGLRGFNPKKTSLCPLYLVTSHNHSIVQVPSFLPRETVTTADLVAQPRALPLRPAGSCLSWRHTLPCHISKGYTCILSTLAAILCSD